MTGGVVVTGFGVRTAFGAGADAVRDGVFDGRPAFAPITRFDTGPYRTGVAATSGPAAPLREVLAETAWAAVAMAGLPAGASAAVLVGTAGDFTGLTRYWRAAAAGSVVDAAGAAGAAGTAAVADTAGAAGAAGTAVVADTAAVADGDIRRAAGTGGVESAGGVATAYRVGAAGVAGVAGVAGSALSGPASALGVAEAGGIAEAVPAWQAAALGEALGVKGPRIAFTNACVASATAVAHGCRLIASGRAETVVCAGAYLVEEENLAKFGSGFALSGEGTMRPFSADRSGLLLGDGAGAVVLESAAGARRRGARALAALTGWGAASDAHHVARPHPRGAGLAAAAARALRVAGGPRVDYVNAHGTATRHNDPAETLGVRAVLGTGADRVPVSSTKSTTGHLLEASGVVELVITLLAVRDGVLPPTAGFTGPDPACDLDYVPNRPRRADIRTALSLNAAFGGANTALVVERA